jgi:MATE family multidrug resistance protein
MRASSREFRRLLELAVPVTVSQVGMMLLGVVDTIMVGHVSVEALGAATLGHIWILGTMMLGMGFIFGIDPVVSQAHGSGNVRRMALGLQRGLVLSGIISVPVALVWLVAEPGLLLFGQDPQLAALAERYVWVQIPSIPVFFAFITLRHYLQDRGIVRPTMYIALIANGFNVVFNWMFIFGNLGVPPLGVLGAGLATALTRMTMLVMLVAVVRGRRLHDGAWIPWSRDAFRRSGLREIVAYGAPVGIQISLEIWAFQISTLLAGLLGRVELAAHTVALNLASLSFMVPLGISISAVTRVGNLLGMGRLRRAQIAAWVALGLGAGAMLVSAAVFVALRHWLPGLYTPDTAVAATAAALLPIAAAFQIFDGTQVVGGGILRGMGKTRPAAVFNLVGYYVLALPLGWWLGFRAGWGIEGVWWGLMLGLAVVAVCLVAWIWKRGPAHMDPREVREAAARTD